jgi:TetR/AcrR family transcriptional regulator, cholesterol catabolism regulator
MREGEDTADPLGSLNWSAAPDPTMAASTTSSAKTKSERTRERILDAAAAAFRERGFAATRLSDIAERAELQTPSLYYHFASKEQLIEEVLALGVVRTFEHVKQRVAEVPADDPIGRLRAAIDAHIEMVLKTGNYSTANLRLYGQMPKEIRDRLQRTQRRVGRYWHQLLKDAQDAGAIRADLDLSATRMLILGALNWTAEWFRAGELSPQELAEQANAIVLDGLIPRP